MRSSFTFLALLGACSSEPGLIDALGCEAEPGPEADVSYDPEHMLCVEVEMASADFDELSAQYRFGDTAEEQFPGVVGATAASCSAPYPNPYTYFHAAVSVDGRELSDVGIRKKGFVGSVLEGSESRPSLKVKTDEYVSGQLLGDTERITLNNNHTDRSRMHTCLAYSVFTDAGYPAPLCNLANVSVNGTPLGAYTHVEPLKKRFLRRAFGNDEGSLYEGTVADFTDAHLAGLPDNLGRWEPKTDATDRTGAPLRRVADALKAPDDALEVALNSVLDLDAFFQFWALETLVGHDDGYASNTNNMYVYFDPLRSGRAVFVPWGPDDAMSGGELSLYATSELTRRLSLHPELSERYLAELQRLLDDVWDEELLLQRIDTFAEQVASAEEPTDTHADQVEELQTWVRDNRGAVQEFIDDGGPVGKDEPGACTGNFEPQDFMVFGEITAVAAHGCATGPAGSGWVGIALLGLWRRRWLRPV